MTYSIACIPTLALTLFLVATQQIGPIHRVQQSPMERLHPEWFIKRTLGLQRAIPEVQPIPESTQKRMDRILERLTQLEQHLHVPSAAGDPNSQLPKEPKMTPEKRAIKAMQILEDSLSSSKEEIRVRAAEALLDHWRWVKDREIIRRSSFPPQPIRPIPGVREERTPGS